MNTAELTRRLDNLVRFGRIAETDFTTDPVQPRARVSTGGLLTDWLRLATVRAGEDAEHDPVTVGEEVILLSPSGELSQAVIVGKLFSAARPSPSTDPYTHHREYRDGAVISYDTKNHHLSAILPDGGTTELTSTGGITFNGNITHNGDLQHNGNASQTGNYSCGGTVAAANDVTAGGGMMADGDVKAGSVSLQQHKHGGVSSGSSTTGPAQ